MERNCGGDMLADGAVDKKGEKAMMSKKCLTKNFFVLRSDHILFSFIFTFSQGNEHKFFRFMSVLCVKIICVCSRCNALHT